MNFCKFGQWIDLREVGWLSENRLCTIV